MEFAPQALEFGEQEADANPNRDNEARTAYSRGADPLYVFACGVQWRLAGEQRAFRELLCAHASHDAVARCVARTFLGKGLFFSSIHVVRDPSTCHED